MFLKIKFCLFFLFYLNLSKFSRCDNNDIKFTVYLSRNISSTWNVETLTSLNCPTSSPITFIIHGWRSSTSDWQQRLKDKFLLHRGGCVIIINWGKLSDNLDYKKVVKKYVPIVVKELTQRIRNIINEGFLADNILIYGHSLGARIAIKTGIELGGILNQIDACDAAGPLFYFYDIVTNFKKAAKNVQCIHTSAEFGTKARKCHQDWLMGVCGIFQPASRPFQNPNLISHNLCNEFYINSFDYDFIAFNKYNCPKETSVDKLPSRFKMGYLETRKWNVKGIIPCPTTKEYPYNYIGLDD